MMKKEEVEEFDEKQYELGKKMTNESCQKKKTSAEFTKGKGNWPPQLHATILCRNLMSISLNC